MTGDWIFGGIGGQGFTFLGDEKRNWLLSLTLTRFASVTDSVIEGAITPVRSIKTSKMIEASTSEMPR